MSVHTLGTDEWPVDAAQVGAPAPDNGPGALRILALAGVCLGVAALAAATFVLSYSAIRAIALQAGITPRLARGYPLLLDAMLVIVLAAVLALRGAGLPSRLLAWLTLLVVIAAAAGADALHAAGEKLPHRAVAITTAVLPWALVLVAFALLVTMLRHARLRRGGSEAWLVADASPDMPPASTQSGGIVQPVLAVAARPAPAQAAVTDAGATGHIDLTDDRPGPADDLSTADKVSDPADGTMPYPAEVLPDATYGDADETRYAVTDDDAGYAVADDGAGYAVADDGAGYAVADDGAGYAAAAESDAYEAGPAEPDEAIGSAEAGPDATGEFSPAPTDRPDDPGMPFFHRMWSSPTPPAET
jgi:Protein of unknown function (DUF2637)